MTEAEFNGIAHYISSGQDLSGVTPYQERIARMYFIDGDSQSEIAAFFGTNQSTVSRAISAVESECWKYVRQRIGTPLPKDSPDKNVRTQTAASFWDCVLMEDTYPDHKKVFRLLQNGKLVAKDDRFKYLNQVMYQIGNPPGRKIKYGGVRWRNSANDAMFGSSNRPGARPPVS